MFKWMKQLLSTRSFDHTTLCDLQALTGNRKYPGTNWGVGVGWVKWQAWEPVPHDWMVSCCCCLFVNQVRVETASRNKQVVGGKKQKRKRSKKEVVLVPRKKKKGDEAEKEDSEDETTRWMILTWCCLKEPRKRPPAHDEVDHQALKMMTRQRVYWTIQEDSMLMLCSVATRLINSKVW